MKNNSVLVSILIPVYNAQQYLMKCINSVIEQTYKNIEIILVDDGSSDGSYNICQEFVQKDSRIKLITKKNGGVVSARKCGATLAQGSYIFCVDSDDFIERNTIEYLLNRALECDADVICPGYIKEKIGKQEYKENYIASGIYRGKLLEYIYSAMFFSGEFYRPGIMPFICSKFFKAALYKQFQASVPEQINRGEDVAVTFPLLEQASCIVVDNEFKPYHYRQNTLSICHSFDSNHFKKCKILFDYLDKSIINKQIRQNLPYFKLFNILSGVQMVQTSSELNLDEKKKLIKDELKQFPLNQIIQESGPLHSLKFADVLKLVMPKINISFDIEDVFGDQHLLNDVLLDIFKFCEENEIPVDAYVSAIKMQILENDSQIMDFLKNSTFIHVGYHSNTHSFRIIPEQNSSSCLKSIEEYDFNISKNIFSNKGGIINFLNKFKTSMYRCPGFCWTPDYLDLMQSHGMKYTTLNIDYPTAFSLQNTVVVPALGKSLERIRSKKELFAYLTRGDVLSVYMHPAMLVYDNFWDAMKKNKIKIIDKRNVNSDYLERIALVKDLLLFIKEHYETFSLKNLNFQKCEALPQSLENLKLKILDSMTSRWNWAQITGFVDFDYHLMRCKECLNTLEIGNVDIERF